MQQSRRGGCSERIMIIITGATGRTGSAQARDVLAKGEKIRVVGRDAKKLQPLVQHCAEALVGNIEEPTFLVKAFDEASAVYLGVPEDTSQRDLRAHQERVTNSFAAAISRARVPYVVALSSVGAHMRKERVPLLVSIAWSKKSAVFPACTSYTCAPDILWKICFSA
jgi:uncharacterized protein YbjT (DUF2867 family)